MQGHSDDTARANGQGPHGTQEREGLDSPRQVPAGGQRPESAPQWKHVCCVFWFSFSPVSILVRSADRITFSEINGFCDGSE